MSFQVNQSLLLANPNFARLYEQLTACYLNPDGTTKKLSCNRNQDFYPADKLDYFENLVIYNAVKKLALQKDSRINKPADINEKTLEAVANCLTFAETKQLLNFRPNDPSIKSNNASLLGLTEEELNKAIENDSRELNKHKETVLNCIENRLTRQCADIAKFYYTEEETKSETQKLLFAKASKLDKILTSQIEELRLAKINRVMNRNQLGDRITNYMDVMKNILSTLWNIIEEFKLRHELRKNTIFNDYFSMLIKNIGLKLRVLRLDTLMVIYDKETLKELMSIRDNLMREEKDYHQKLDALEAQLSRYQGVCGEFEQIVQCYSNLNKEIEKTKDDIQRMTM
ncbi:HAUS augmin-like complex subunit 4 [Gigaspora margarita]|uniref:HAUS augmin-like complex subunit 4 n=1 Tax=Gigaspora margarita TaxID=4874 RepID=A0A8H3X608_GIGMA|nr:HAUS augmin-like complex subunit 4 [Gigaspora margarita]